MEIQNSRSKPTAPPRSNEAAAAKASDDGKKAPDNEALHQSTDRLLQARTGTVGKLLDPDGDAMTAKLGDLGQKLDRSLETSPLDDAQRRFRDRALGFTGGSKAIGSALESVKDQAGSNGGTSKNPLDAARHQNVAGGGAGHLMQDKDDGAGNGAAGGAAPGGEAGGASPPAGGAEDSSSTWQAVKDWASGAASALFGTVGGGAFSVLTANGTPEGKRNEAEGIKAFGRMHAGEYSHEGMDQVQDPFSEPKKPDATPEQTPTPEGEQSRPTFTHHDNRGMAARTGGLGGKVDDGVGRGSGFVNQSATPEGKHGQQSEYAGYILNSAVINDAVLSGIEAKINGKIEKI